MSNNSFSYSFKIYITTATFSPLLYVLPMMAKDASNPMEYMAYTLIFVILCLLVGIPCWGLMWFTTNHLVMNKKSTDTIRVALSALSLIYILASMLLMLDKQDLNRGFVALLWLIAFPITALVCIWLYPIKVWKL